MAEGTKVLIVEDDKFLSELISTKLSKEGFDVTLATDGEAGLAKANEVKPEIILLDIMLPGMSGFEVLESLKTSEDESVKNIPVLILSNFGQESKVQQGLKLGAKDYLVKANFTTGEIVEKIRAALGQ
ncbi:MAG: response regulator [Candidatus Kerfeldbacteria bacterium CG15_BIG_FIL_POST_REV_8_21_14_020_45_12]|uniref:Response regulator n=1 Tax=Candidatus Kerfeldbacteria bacterium CG15_BIG_FIL_POST_REV_8_21_14_020_45_12 TaxID=2014247 RepID=A0A2M7H228_9BACT|nr:MAG: response regulator [Candidatus Kerfeldbacteria bacterium CG15_BIG_FIL_POST_REV_8_21_14_020_45_12]PJA92883.1 MAG: response regulator [Candidatus Kerfeldbacteria bacterium CG_4_9_14_3_um_filter_45_8]